ncbi:response regulator [Breznakiella homolactica]|uniref:histidine kinase n=1 Tax=Breznakiella homolactica TaxID=2798577 RepID=A0A7T7XM30_9SPIR|nr:response regulator [Breznakiella homolactica]QQO08881.1 response regulator [Breznakiella homolactica]
MESVQKKLSNDSFIKILRGMDVQLLVTAPDTDHIIFINDKMKKGYAIDYDPTGQPCWQALHGYNSRCEFCPLQQLYEKPDTPIEWDYRHERTGRWFHNRESMIEWTDGALVHMQQAMDITGRKKLEEDLVAAKDQAEYASKTKGDFLSRMSHEIRTPINAIIGMTGIALKSDSIERIRECLGSIDDASVHLLGVINDILDMSKIEAGKFDLSNSDFVLEYMLQRVTNVNNFRFEQKGQHFTILVDTDVPTSIVADQQRLAQVITNLLSNAAKFTPNGGRITLSVKSLGEEDGYCTLCFEVTDEGIGMTEEEQSRLFRSFEQADGSITRRFGGTGLGLAISKTIVEMMDGSISVRSVPGKGSGFTFTIRVKRGFATRSSHLSPNVDWSKVRILAADGSEDVLRYFDAITDSLGIACDTVRSGQASLEKIREQPYQVVFVDWLLPDMTGMELVGKIRAQSAEPVSVIMVSAGDRANAEEAASAGIEYIISKPLLPSPIIDCINRCFGERTKPVDQLQANGISNADIFLGRRLLLVEDVEVNREIIKAMLEETGIEITEAENGQTACGLFDESGGDYDLVFMDIHMPLMDGYSATRIIRSKTHIPRAAAIPIIAMTANVFREDIDRCLEAGMNDHIGKPVNADEMIAKMKQYVPVGR